MHLLGLDVGTTGCKAIVFDEQANPLGHAFHEYDVICSEPGMAEQDAEHVWRLTQQVMREAVIRSSSREIEAVSISVQGDAIIPTTSDFRALHPAILGMDYRSEPQARWCDETFGGLNLFQSTGMRPHAMNSIVKTLWLREQKPDVFNRAERIVTYGDFVLGKLGAEAVIDHTMASRTMAFDLKNLQWDRKLLGQLGINETLLSKPVPSGEVVGRMAAEVAAGIGLRNQPALVTGAHDQPCAGIGSGVIREGIGVISSGTAEVLSTAFNAPALSVAMFKGYYPCYLHARPGMFFTFALNHIGGILLKWYRDNFGIAETLAAGQSGTNPYALIDARMPDAPSPLMVVPHWNGSGTPHCDMSAKGAIIGWTMASTRHDLAKAILEGLTFELLINLNTMMEAGVRVDQLAAAGGGAKSNTWLQLKADILNRPIRTLRCREAACLGAALLAGAATGVYQNLDEAVRLNVHYDKEFAPRADAARIYADRFRAYQRIYPALRPLNQLW